MDEMERQELDLDEIMKEFGVEPLPQEPEQAPEQPQEETLTEETMPWPIQETQPDQDMQATRRIEPVKPAEEQVTGDTIRLNGLRDEIVNRAHRDPIEGENGREEARVWQPQDTVHNEPFSEHWEPEYDEPIGEYVPPQPIQFNPRSRFRELKKKLVAGPEKRFYELSEIGVGRLQVAIFFSLLVVLIAAVSTVMYAFGAVQENRMRLMVFGQFLAMLVSALLGSYQLMEGFADLKNKKVTLNTLLLVTFFVCCVDGIVCLKQLRVPCCAAFSLEVTMSLWSAYQKRNAEMSQMDTMRKAIRLDGLVACPDYFEQKKGLLRKEGQVEDFMDTYAGPCRPEKRLQIYSLIAMILAFVLGVCAGVLESVATGIQVTAVSLLAAVPATAFICHSRPTWILERKLHRLGTVLCGWQGVEGISGNALFPITYEDLYPVGTVRLNGVKYFGSQEPDTVVAYAAAVMAADANGLAPLFAQVLDTHNGRHYDAYHLEHYENGGVRGVVEGQTVLLGSASFMKEMDVIVPENARLGYAVYVAIDGELSGLFAVSYEKTQSVAAGLTTLNAYKGLYCTLVSDDFMLTPGFFRNKFAIKTKRLLLPEHETRVELRQKEASEDAPVLLMTTALGLAPLAYGVTGARVLKNTCRMGTVLHIVGGAVGLAIMTTLVLLGAFSLLTPVNMFLYQLVWMIPALLITEWTRSI